MNTSSLRSVLNSLSLEIALGMSILMTTALLFLPLNLNAAKLDSFSRNEAFFDIVFDLDWTLVNPTNEKMAAADASGIIRAENIIYRLSDYAIDVLIALHRLPEVQISFFSGGSAGRNQILIEQIYQIINARTGHDEFKPKLVLNLEHMDSVSKDKRLKFSVRNKKNLAKFFNLARVLLVEDVHDFVPTGQEKNLLFLGKTYNDRIRFDLVDLEAKSDREYSAPNYEEWLRDRKK